VNNKKAAWAMRLRAGVIGEGLGVLRCADLGPAGCGLP
jgi:hypothetical protein